MINPPYTPIPGPSAMETSQYRTYPIGSSHLDDLSVHGQDLACWASSQASLDAVPRSKRNQSLLERVGARVAEARKARGWTQSKLAEVVQVGDVTLSRLETGSRGMSLSMLAKIAQALELGLGELIDVGQPIPQSQRTPAENELLVAFRALEPDEQDLAVRIVKEIGK